MTSDYSLIRRAGFIAALMLTAIAAQPASATITINSSAVGFAASLKLASFATVGIAPLGSVGGTSAPAYDLAGGVAALDQTLRLDGLVGLVRQRVRTGVITTTATSVHPVAPTGNGSATVNNLRLDLTLAAPIGPAINLLRVTATSIQSASSVEGVGAASATGSSLLTNLALSGTLLGGLTINSGASFAPSADFALLDLLGIKVVLNEQLRSGDSAASAGITTTALRLRFKDVLVSGGLLNGDIVVGQSHASVFNDNYAGTGAVPEPAVWAQMITGFGLIGVVARRRRRASVIAA